MTSPESGAFRIIDADLNRTGEGLRVMEDFARLLLNDGGLTRQLKELRHELLEASLSINKKLLQARDSAGDVGADIEAPGQDEPKEIALIVVANSRRVQESLRVVEEMAKLPGIGLDSARFRRARFKLYTLERELLSRLLRQDKAKKHLTGLYAVIDASGTGAEGAAESARRALAAGACAIELKCPPGGAIPLAEEIRRICRDVKALYIINDRLDVALAAGADGLLLESDTIPASRARGLLPIDSLLGVSVRTPEQGLAAREAGADYVVAAVGASHIRDIRQASKIPLIAVAFSAGIVDNIPEIRAAGADAIALDFSGLDTEVLQIAACFSEK